MQGLQETAREGKEYFCWNVWSWVRACGSQRVQWGWHHGENVLLTTWSVWGNGQRLLETPKGDFGSYDVGSYRNFNFCWKDTVVRIKLSRWLLDGVGYKFLIQVLEGPTRMTHRWTCHSLA